MSRWANGLYEVVNRDKYVGRGTPRYRSGWEHSFMRFCDTNDNILQWASESIAIPHESCDWSQKQLCARLLDHVSQQRQHRQGRTD